MDYDRNGNPFVDKRRQRSRIDALQAALLAVGAGEREANTPPPVFDFLSLEELAA